MTELKKGWFGRQMAKAQAGANNLIWWTGLITILGYLVALGSGKLDFEIYYLKNKEWYYTEILQGDSQLDKPGTKKAVVKPKVTATPKAVATVK